MKIFVDFHFVLIKIIDNFNNQNEFNCIADKFNSCNEHIIKYSTVNVKCQLINVNMTSIVFLTYSLTSICS